MAFAGRIRPLLAVWLASAGLAACSSHTSATGTDPAGAITVTIALPKANSDGTAPLITGAIDVTGTLSFAPHVALDSPVVLAIVGVAGSASDCSVVGSAFLCHFDSSAQLNGQPSVACNDTATLQVRASGTLDGEAVSGTAEVDAVVDNCPPTIAIDAPADGEPFIGTLTVIAHLADPALAEAHITVTDAAGQSVLAQPADLPPGTTTWNAKVQVDLSATKLTQDLTITLTARDAVGLKTQLLRTVTLVKPPFFLGSDQGADRFDPGLDSLSQPVDLQITDFALGKLVPFANTPPLATDNLVDAVLGTTNGLVIRAGLPVRDALGVATGAPKYQPSGRFDNPMLDPALAPLRVIQDSPHAVAIARVFLLDLDGDGDEDIVAVGTNWEYAGVAWAVLNLAKHVPGAPPVPAFKLVATHALPAPPLSAALGDLNADGQPDLLVGAATADVGLMTLLVQKAPMCTPTDGSAPKLCAQFTDVDLVKSATVFPADAATTLHKGVTGVTSIAVADFYKDDKQLNDVCVGESARGIVSCYRNVAGDGTLAQAQDSYTFGDAQDTHAIVAAKFSAGGGPDLIVQSTSGKFVRWLTGDHNGGFQFVENNTPSRNIYGLGCSTLGVGQVGPAGLGGKPYLTAISDTRKVTIVPTQLDDQSYALQCFRAWVLGGQLTKVEATDLDGDNAPDLVALDVAEPGLAVAFGQLDKDGVFNGNFIAPDAHHVCAQDRTPDGYGVYEIGEALLSDYDGDNRKDLTVLSIQGGTTTGAHCDGAKTLDPVWTFAVFLNTVDGVVNPQPRMGEFAPFADADSGLGHCSDAIGSVHAARAGDVDGDGIPDLVTVRHGAPYFLFSESCGVMETAEVDNFLGPVSPPPPPAAPGCPTTTGAKCRNYSENDECFAKPLQGYGGGAPLLRASAGVFLSSPTGPLGMAASCAVGNVCHVSPGFAFSAGLDPQGLVLADLNHDGALDVATAMEANGNACSDPHALYLAPRVRVFQGDGTGTFTVAPLGLPKDEILLKPCDAPDETPTPFAVSYRQTVAGIGDLQAGIWPNPSSGKFDLALFILGQANGQVSWLAHTSALAFTPAQTFALGTDVKAFAVRDVNFDPHMQVDVLALLGVDLSYLPGAVLADGKTGFFGTKVTLAEGAQAADWLDAGDVNDDTFQDFVLLNKTTSTLELWLGVGRSPTPLSAQFVHYPGTLRAAMDAQDTEIADMDGDGCVDIIVRSKRAVTVLHNEGVGCSGALHK